MKQVLFSLFAMFMALSVKAQQDTIVKRNGDILPCKIIEITDYHVRFTLNKPEDKLNYATKRKDISHVIFKNGERMPFNPKRSQLWDKNWEDNPSQFQINLISLVNTAPNFILEKSLNPTRSLQMGFAAVFNGGLDYEEGGQKDYQRAGLNLSLGAKQYFKGSQSKTGRFTGAFFQPELIFSYLSVTEADMLRDNGGFLYRGEDNSFSTFGVALIPSLGLQLQFSKSITFGVQVGAGAGFVFNEDGTSSHGNANNRGNWIYFPPNNRTALGVALKAGMHLGFIF